MICTAAQGSRDAITGQCDLCGHPGMVHPNPASSVDACVICQMNEVIVRTESLATKLEFKIAELGQQIARQKSQ